MNCFSLEILMDYRRVYEQYEYKIQSHAARKPHALFLPLTSIVPAPLHKRGGGCASALYLTHYAPCSLFRALCAVLFHHP